MTNRSNVIIPMSDWCNVSDYDETFHKNKVAKIVNSRQSVRGEKGDKNIKKMESVSHLFIS